MSPFKPSMMILVICATALMAIPSSVEASGVKGMKKISAPISDSQSVVTRNLKEDKTKKTKLKGPTSRSCQVSEKPDEVKFQCRSAGRSGSSKDGKNKASSKDAKSSSTTSRDGAFASHDHDSKDGHAHDSRDGAMDSRDGAAGFQEEGFAEEDLQSRGITISSEDIEDEINYKVKTTDKGIRVDIEYEQEIKTADIETETETKFDLLFENLVEYVKASGSGTGTETEGGDSEETSEAYDWDQDTILQTIPLSGWDAIPGIVNDDGGVVSYFTATTSSGMNAGSIAFNFTISRAEEGERLTANRIKIDVLILDFPWTRSDSYLALLSTVESKKKVEMTYDEEATVSTDGKAKKARDVTVVFGEDGVEEALGFSTYGAYTWAESADSIHSIGGDSSNCTVSISRQGFLTADNSDCVDETIHVIATSPTQVEEDGSQKIAYSFVGEGAKSASEIYWDPEAGIEYEAEAESGSCIPSLGLVGSIVGALLVLLW